jgi:hypothetical protein
MTLHGAIGVLVAVSLPAWLVIEKIFKWRALNAAGSPQHAEGQVGASNAPGTPAEVSPVTRATSSAALTAAILPGGGSKGLGALSNAFAFGRCNATLVFRKYAEGRPA